MPAARKTKVIVTPAKKRAPPKKKPTRVSKIYTAVVSDEESDSSQLLKDPESSEPENDSVENKEIKKTIG